MRRASTTESSPAAHPTTGSLQAGGRGAAPPARKPRTRRNLELLLLVPALAVGYCAYLVVGVGRTKEFAPDLSPWLALPAAMVLIFHGVLRWRVPYADPVILPVVVTLNGLGLVMIHRIDLSTGATAGTRQMQWTAIAITAAIVLVVMLRDHRLLRRYTYTALIVSALLLVLPLAPGLGREINGARIWIFIGPFSFQPGEIAKITLAVFFAGYLSSNRDMILLAGRKLMGLRFPRFRDLGPMVTAWAMSVGVLVFQRDLGTSLLFFGLFMVMIYMATGRASWILLGLGLVLVAGVAAARLFSHVQARITIWLNPFDQEIYDREFGGSYQLVQGLFGLGSGGLTGAGWGEGRPSIVPFANSDFIIASLGEELGLVGMAVVLALFLVLIARGFRTALATRDAFGKLLVGGLAFTLAWQCFVVIGGVTRLIPLTGLTTPFLAAGGSSLVANWIIAALLLVVSHAARRPEAAAAVPSQEPALVPLKEGTGQQRNRTGDTPNPAHDIPGNPSTGTEVLP